MMFRITDVSHTNAMLAAVNRGVPVRLITDEERIPQPGSPVGRLQRGHDVPRRRAGEAGRAPGHRPREGGHPVRPGHLDHRLVELDVAVDQLAARAQLLHDAAVRVSVAARHSSSASGTTARATPRRRRSCRSRPVQPVYSLAGQRRRLRSRQPASCCTWNGGLWGQIYDIYFGTTPNSAAARREPAARSQPNVHRLPQVHAAVAAARHDVLLEDRVEDDGVRHQRRTGLELHNRGLGRWRRHAAGPLDGRRRRRRSASPAAPAIRRRHSRSTERARTSGERPTPSITCISRCPATAPSSRASRRFRTSPRGRRPAS